MSAKQNHRQEHGIALILVLFVIALAGAMTYYISSATYMATSLHNASIQRTQAEYLLKSALNVARVVISQGQGSADPPPDSWGQLTNGIVVDARTLGFNAPNVLIGLEVTGIESKISLRRLHVPGQSLSAPARAVLVRWRDIFTRLFRALGFDDDNEQVYEGQFKGQFFNSEQLIANIIDYQDQDEFSYSDSGFADGVESQLAKPGFPNRLIKRLDELNQVPGFTPNRIKRLSPFVTTEDVRQINVNLASITVLRALDDSIDDVNAQEIIAYAKGPDGPFNLTTKSQILPSFIPNFSQVDQLLKTTSDLIQVIAKVQYGTNNTYFLKALVEKPRSGSGTTLPEVKEQEIYG